MVSVLDPPGLAYDVTEDIRQHYAGKIPLREHGIVSSRGFEGLVSVGVVLDGEIAAAVAVEPEDAYEFGLRICRQAVAQMDFAKRPSEGRA